MWKIIIFDVVTRRSNIPLKILSSKMCFLRYNFGPQCIQNHTNQYDIFLTKTNDRGLYCFILSLTVVIVKDIILTRCT